MKITNRLAELRAQTGKTQGEVISELEEMLGTRPFTRQMLSHYETGRHYVPADELALFCRYYGCHPGDILKLEEVASGAGV
jgi:transcriptional regulator with XRE-family HTH domain